MLPLPGPDTYLYRGGLPGPFNPLFTFSNKMICPDGDNSPYHKEPVIAQPITVPPVYVIRSFRPPTENHCL